MIYLRIYGNINFAKSTSDISVSCFNNFISVAILNVDATESPDNCPLPF